MRVSNIVSHAKPQRAENAQLAELRPKKEKIRGLDVSKPTNPPPRTSPKKPMMK